MRQVSDLLALVVEKLVDPLGQPVHRDADLDHLAWADDRRAGKQLP